MLHGLAIWVGWGRAMSQRMCLGDGRYGRSVHSEIIFLGRDGWTRRDTVSTSASNMDNNGICIIYSTVNNRSRNTVQYPIIYPPLRNDPIIIISVKHGFKTKLLIKHPAPKLPKNPQPPKPPAHHLQRIHPRAHPHSEARLPDELHARQCAQDRHACAIAPAGQ